MGGGLSRPYADDPTLQKNRPEDNNGPECVVAAPSHTTAHSYSSQAEDSVSKYEYRPLSTPSTIRLIEVMRDKVDGCIAYMLYTFDMQNCPDTKYKALSYVWGHPTKSRRVFLAYHGDEQWRPYPLHENHWRFLNSAWQRELFGQLFWTDYLCLNQNDDGEVAQQIPRMGSIYSNADQVLACIQLSKGHHRRVLRYLE